MLARTFTRLMTLALALLVLAAAMSLAGIRMPRSVADLERPQSLLAPGSPLAPDAPLAPGTPAAPAPAPVSADPSDFSFMAENASGSPARWNPCEPVRYLVNAERGGAGALQDVHEAFRRISAATGIEFVYAGATSEVPTSSWGRSVPAPPVLVAWASPGETDILGEGVAGTGGGDLVRTGAGKRYVTGSAVLNAEMTGTYAPGFATGQSRGVLLMHELAHVVGLGHSEGAGTVMFGSVGYGTPTQFAAGDLAGLARLGASAGCM